LNAARILVLVPTAEEQRRLIAARQWELPREASVRLCGFGPVAAAARTGRLVGETQATHVLLVGIAGSYDTAAAPLGTALVFRQIAVWGIGAGEGAAHLLPSQLDLAQWRRATDHQPIFERLGLAECASGPSAETLLTVTSAAASADEVRFRRQRFPDAVAEDMEGFGVALACHLAGVPLVIVRGISNRAGDRAKENWRIGEALDAAAALASDVLRELSQAPAR